MITSSAKEGFNLLLTQALKDSLAPSGAHCEVSMLADDSSIRESKMAVLTVSSYLFRLMVMFHFTPDAATLGYFSRLNNAAADVAEQECLDAIAERGNLCCGILNRELSAYFPHIGMSTPNVIDRHCAAYLQMLNCGHIQHFAIDIDDAPRLHVSLCVSEYAEIDFTVDAEAGGSNTGELELF
ncbi:MAG TPA: hypothetical protein VL528_01940 [Oxalicibacterium sp.]|nr:hypothetical protein [Oxalicibacterium sp.]